LVVYDREYESQEKKLKNPGNAINQGRAKESRGFRRGGSQDDADGEMSS
jgi:hypothetical protein